MYDKMTVNGFEMFSWKRRITFKIKFVLLVKINIYFCFWVLDSCIWFFLKDHILNFIPRCQISTFEQCQEWLKRLNTAVRPPSRLEDLFAFAFHAWCMEVYAGEKEQHGELCRPGTLLIARLSLQKLTQTCILLIGHLCCHCRWTCDLMVQEWGGEDGLWHSKCLEDIWYQQQVQVDAAFFQDTASVLISELQLEDGFHPLLSLANSTSQYVLNSGWLCYCTPWVLNPGQIRGWPRIRCLQTDFCWAITILWCSLSLFNFALCALLHCQALPQLSSATPSASLDYWQRARKCGSLPLLEEVSCCSLQVCVLKQLLKADTWPVYH